MSGTKRILIGHISAAHGIRGEVVLVSHAGRPEDIAAYGALSDETGERTFVIEHVRRAGKGLIGRIRGIADRTAAEALKGTRLYLTREQLPETDEDEWYHADLIGLTATGPDGIEIGSVVAVHNFGAGDILDVQPAAGGPTVLVPFDRTHVPEIDIRGGRLVIVLPDYGGNDGEIDGDPASEADGSDRERGPGAQ